MEKCGFIAILGAPNAGKSTLVNQLVGQKVSIVSPKVQTTRSRIMGIALKDKCQLILVDTPGIFEAKKKLDIAMVKEAFDASADSDANILVIDVTKPNMPLAQQLCQQHKKGLIVCLNKIDLIDKDKLLKILVDLKKSKKKISLCHGVFDLVHYGHILHFKSAKKISDILIVSITKDKFIKKGIGRPLFNEIRRLNYLSEISIIDYVYICETESAEDSIKTVKPDFYVKGQIIKIIYWTILRKFT